MTLGNLKICACLVFVNHVTMRFNKMWKIKFDIDAAVPMSHLIYFSVAPVPAVILFGYKWCIVPSELPYCQMHYL